jgi:hypothetical protein
MTADAGTLSAAAPAVEEFLASLPKVLTEASARSIVGRCLGHTMRQLFRSESTGADTWSQRQQSKLARCSNNCTSPSSWFPGSGAHAL